MINKTKTILKYILVTILVAGFIYVLNKMNIFKNFGSEEVKKYINSFGLFSPFVYVIILTLLPLLFFPDSVIVIAGGMIFGLGKGIILTSLGSFLGATISFYISRLLGRKMVSKLMKGKSVDLEKYSKQSGLLIILMLRLIPLFPFKAVSYSAGLSSISFKDFTIATIIGSIPGIVVYTNLGDKSTDVGSSGFYMSIVLVILLFVVSLLLKKKFSKDEIESENTSKKSCIKEDANV